MRIGIVGDSWFDWRCLVAQSDYPKYTYEHTTEWYLRSLRYDVINLARGGASMRQCHDRAKWLVQQGCERIIWSATDTARDLDHIKDIPYKDFYEWERYEHGLYAQWDSSCPVPILWISGQAPVEWPVRWHQQFRQWLPCAGEYSPFEWPISTDARLQAIRNRFPQTPRERRTQDSHRAIETLHSRISAPNAWPDGVHPATSHYSELNKEIDLWLKMKI